MASRYPVAVLVKRSRHENSAVARVPFDRVHRSLTPLCVIRLASPGHADPSLTLTRVQCPAIVGKAVNRKPCSYAEFANLRNAQQPLTAHS